MRYLDRLQPLALLLMRLSLGLTLVVHSSHQVFNGSARHAQVVSALGLPPWLGYIYVLTEFLGGLFVLAGFFTRAAAFILCIDVVIAIWKINWHNGLTGDHGFEFPLALATLAFALIFFGAGPIALDHILRGGSTVSKR